MAGTFGYELNLGLLTEEEKKEVKEQVKKFKQYAPLIQRGDYYRLSSPQKDEFGAWAFVSEDQSEALISIVMLKQHGNMTVNYVKMRGLKPFKPRVCLVFDYLPETASFSALPALKAGTTLAAI